MNKPRPQIHLKKIIQTGLTTTAILIVAGCATTTAISPTQCQSGNWEEIGLKDGQQGRSGAYFGRYIDACQPTNDIASNRILWEQGRQRGLKSYCTELNAYQLGREGYDWRPVCPLEGIEKLEDAYSQGRYYYLRQQDMDYLNAPVPWGYDSFFHPRYRFFR